MTEHEQAVTGQAFRQFQYPTVPLHVRSDYVERAWADANQRVEYRLTERT